MKKVIKLVSISLLVCMLIVSFSSIVTAMSRIEKNNIKNATHEIAQLARQIGLSEDDPIIKRAQELWWEAHNTPAYTEDELFCMAAVIYQEVGSDYICDECRYRVGDVVLNRVADSRFPNTIRGVLEAKNQYGKFYRTGVKFPERANNPNEKHAVERAYETARALLANERHSELYEKGYVWQAGFIQGKDSVYCCNHYFGR